MKESLIELLKTLIATPSFSREEDSTADVLEDYLIRHKIKPHRFKNNIWAVNMGYHPNKPSMLLNSHHDTVKPVDGWTRDPFLPEIKEGRIYGLGSNDAGASLVGLLGCFLHYNGDRDLPINLVFCASAEEEISGPNGISAVLGELPKIDFGVVGEPTGMRMAIAEKGLVVIDGKVRGKAGHAARDEGENAIYKALKEIEKLRAFKFDRISPVLGEVKISITQIKAGIQHNVVPDLCEFVMDVRTTEKYSNQEVLEILKEITGAEMEARSLRLNSSGIALDHPMVKAGLSLGIETFGSSTLSDQALMNFPTIKMGIGLSERSHTADEYIEIEELEQGFHRYKIWMERLIELLGK